MMNTKRQTESKAARVDQAQRAAQQRLADKSFSAFMRQHNRSQKPFEPNPRGL